MSVCLCSFRALTRSRTPSKSLAPFLYQTATIQQRNPISRRNASDSSRRSRSEHDVPFEGEELPPVINDAKVNRKTTITGSERAAFEKLYKKFNNAEQKEFDEHELDQIADEYYEDDDDNSKDRSPESIDSIFDAVLSGKTPRTDTQFSPVRARSKKSRTDMETLAREILAPEEEHEKRKKKEAAAQKQVRIRDLRNSEKDRVKALLEAAPTDQALWAVLEKEVFSVIRGMDLENGFLARINPKSLKSNVQRAAAGLKSSEISASDPTIVYPNYGYHLLTAAHTLRSNFPASPLMFNILPTIKSLGRSSYALGANTALYKVLIRTAFRQNHSYAQVCSLLQDMDNGGIEYDYGVANLVDEMLDTHHAADKGHYGRGMQAMMRLEFYGEGADKLRAWRSAIRRRLGDFAEEKKERGHLIRKTGRKDFSALGPRDDVLIKTEKVRVGGKRFGAGVHDDIPLVDGEVPFVEERSRPEAMEEMSPDVESFLRDTVDAPVDAPVEAPVEATVPSVEEQSSADEKEAQKQRMNDTV
ncbi:uncharacterized protein N0V89_010295 [Didymosphaeria variabile]|uniref:PpiC domain-containing protein n=1 Tax=Didymosphaeria variabile TaxID=1932322 RepID=A0A9W8XD10_9PLEO|nr:uncharacterized protein N0V89_010295 [Didymosphaeria variabile]KAJ4346366.1 hypothetical protein N0V89_010295 [Didymosphaeria variabile]